MTQPAKTEHPQVWRGKLIAVCDYAASYTSGDAIWNEGYPVWWHLTSIRLYPNRFHAEGVSGCGV